MNRWSKSVSDSGNNEAQAKSRVDKSSQCVQGSAWARLPGACAEAPRGELVKGSVPAGLCVPCPGLGNSQVFLSDFKHSRSMFEDTFIRTWLS